MLAPGSLLSRDSNVSAGWMPVGIHDRGKLLDTLCLDQQLDSDITFYTDQLGKVLQLCSLLRRTNSMSFVFP